MSEIRSSGESLLCLYTATDAELRASGESLFVLYTEQEEGGEIRVSANSLLVLYTDPSINAPPASPDCSFGSSFQPGVRRGQGVCE